MSHERTMPRRPSPQGARRADTSALFDVGDDVEVFSGYERTWSSGFSIAQVLGGRRYRLRRSMDGTLLPDPTGVGDIRHLPQPGQR
jgi:hypothetical protein